MVVDNDIDGLTSSSWYIEAADEADTASGRSAGGNVDVRRIALRKESGLSSVLIVEAGMMLDSSVCM
jgi:hypothetical protein